MSAQEDKLLSIGEAAHFLKVSIDTLRNWDAQGKLIPTRTAGGTRKYLLSTLSNFSRPERTSSAVKNVEKQISNNDKQYLETSEAAEYLGVSYDTLINWEAAGKINSSKTSKGKRKFSLTELGEIKQTNIRLINKTAQPQLSTIEDLMTYLDGRKLEAEEVTVFSEAEIPAPAIRRQTSAVRQLRMTKRSISIFQVF